MSRAQHRSFRPNLADQLSAHIGEWVAVHLQQVVAFGETAAEAVRRASEAGYTDPLVFHVSEHPERAAFF